MSENLTFGQGTYNRPDMLPDSGDEMNSLWGRYLAENAEHVYAHRNQLIYGANGFDDDLTAGNGLGTIYQADASRTKTIKVWADDVGTVHLQGYALKGTATVDLNGIDCGTLGGSAAAGEYNTTTALGTRLSAGWHTVTISAVANTTLHSINLWGSP